MSIVERLISIGKSLTENNLELKEINQDLDSTTPKKKTVFDDIKSFFFGNNSGKLGLFNTIKTFIFGGSISKLGLITSLGVVGVLSWYLFGPKLSKDGNLLETFSNSLTGTSKRLSEFIFGGDDGKNLGDNLKTVWDGSILGGFVGFINSVGRSLYALFDSKDGNFTKSIMDGDTSVLGRFKTLISNIGNTLTTAFGGEGEMSLKGAILTMMAFKLGVKPVWAGAKFGISKLAGSGVGRNVLSSIFSKLGPKLGGLLAPVLSAGAALLTNPVVLGVLIAGIGAYLLYQKLKPEDTAASITEDNIRQFQKDYERQASISNDVDREKAKVELSQKYGVPVKDLKERYMTFRDVTTRLDNIKPQQIDNTGRKFIQEYMVALRNINDNSRWSRLSKKYNIPEGDLESTYHKYLTFDDYSADEANKKRAELLNSVRNMLPNNVQEQIFNMSDSDEPMYLSEPISSGLSSYIHYPNLKPGDIDRLNENSFVSWPSPMRLSAPFVNPAIDNKPDLSFSMFDTSDSNTRVGSDYVEPDKITATQREPGIPHQAHIPQLNTQSQIVQTPVEPNSVEIPPIDPGMEDLILKLYRYNVKAFPYILANNNLQFEIDYLGAQL